MGCARCHDHKFDPIPQRDFYRMQAIFAPAMNDQVSLDYNPSRGYESLTKSREFKLWQIGETDRATQRPYRETHSRDEDGAASRDAQAALKSRREISARRGSRRW